MAELHALTAAIRQAIESAATPPPAAGGPSTIAAASFKAPEFWEGDPEMWFTILEAKFRDNRPAITQDATKYDKVLVALKPTQITCRQLQTCTPCTHSHASICV